VADELRVIHEFDGAVLAAQIGLVIERLKAEGADPASVDVRQIAGETIWRDVRADLTARGVEFDVGCGWSLTGGFLSVSFQLIKQDDIVIVRSLVPDWMPT